MSDEIEALARSIAEQAHQGQVDKAGEPYIGHVSRVAARLDDPLDRAVAWLHDVVEDTDWTVMDLRMRDVDAPPGSRGGWSHVCGIVGMLSHHGNEPRRQYYDRIRFSDRAVRVKLADIADNSDPARLAVLDDATRERLERKYADAREALTRQEGTG